MTFVHRLRQRIRYAGAQADHGGLFDAELHRDRIGGLEADAPDVPGEAIGVLGHDLHGVDAVGLVDANGPGGSDPVAMKEDHDLPDDLLLGPGVGDPLGPNHANARHLAKPIGFGLDDVEDLLAEGLDHFLGVDRPDAPDHAGAQIFLDPFDRTRRRRLEKPRLELLTVSAIVGPFAGCGDPLAGGNDGGVPDDGHQIAVSARLRPQYAEAVLGVVEGDPLDEAGEHFLRRRRRIRLHADRRILLFRQHAKTLRRPPLRELDPKWRRVRRLLDGLRSINSLPHCALTGVTRLVV